MNRTKKGFLIVFLIVTLIGILYVVNLGVVWGIFSNLNMWKNSADFENYTSEFSVVKDYVKEQYSSENGKWVVVSITDAQGRTLFDPDDNDYIDIPSEVRVSLETICDYGFPSKDSVLDVIRIHGNRVSFCIANGRYALVYSPDEKPTWLSSPDEQRDIKVKEIDDDWYHVVEATK